MLCCQQRHKAEGGQWPTAARQMFGGVASTTTAVTVCHVSRYTINNDQEGQQWSAGSWWGGGEDVCWPLPQATIDRPAANNRHHCLPGWRLDNQCQPQEEEEGDSVGPGGGADEAQRMEPQYVTFSNQQGTGAWRDDESDGYQQQERLSMTAMAINNGDGYRQWLSTTAFNND